MLQPKETPVMVYLHPTIPDIPNTTICVQAEHFEYSKWLEKTSIYLNSCMNNSETNTNILLELSESEFRIETVPTLYNIENEVWWITGIQVDNYETTEENRWNWTIHFSTEKNSTRKNEIAL